MKIKRSGSQPSSILLRRPGYGGQEGPAEQVVMSDV
jgi:hypothetical protein